MAGLGATYSVAVEFGIRNRMAQGVRAIQTQMRGIQAQVTAAGKNSAQQLQRLQQQAARYGTIFGNPRSFEETKRNLATIQRTRMRYQNQLAVAQTVAEREALRNKIGALDITRRDLQGKLQAFQVTVNDARTKERMARLADKERREEERALQRRRQMYRNIGGGAFRVAEYSGIGALGIGGALFESAKAAAQQQQLAATTAMVLGLRGPGFQRAISTLMQSQLNTSMQVGMLSSADIAAVQTQLAMHVPGLGLSGLQRLTPLIAKYADVMKMTLGADVTESAKTAAMAANIFGARGPKQMQDFLNRFFVMEQSTGVDQDTAVKALSQYGAMGKALGFSPQAMLDLYGQAFRLGAGGGKAGARLAAVMRGLAEIPTTVVKDYFMRNLGLVDAQGIPNVLKQGGQLRLEPFLRGLHNTYEASIRKYGPARGKALFVTGLYKSYGAAAGNMLFPLIQSGSLNAYEQQKKREAQFYSIEQAQAVFFHMPINQYQRFLTNFKTFLVEFGTYGLPLFTEFFKNFANQMQQATVWMQTHPDTIKKIFKYGVDLAEVLGGLTIASSVVGTAAKFVEGFLTIRSGLGIFAKAMGKAGAIETGMDDLATAVSAKGAGGLMVARLGTIAGSLVPIAATLAFLRGLQINAKMGTKGINPNVLTPGTTFGSNYAFPGQYNLVTGEAIQAPTSGRNGPWEINVYVGNKKIVPETIRVLNKGMRPGMNATTTRQGTVYQSPIETLNQALQPHIR